MGHSWPLFLYFFRFSNSIVKLVDKILPMTVFESQISGVGSDRSTNWATTTAPKGPRFGWWCCWSIFQFSSPTGRPIRQSTSENSTSAVPTIETWHWTKRAAEMARYESVAFLQWNNLDIFFSTRRDSNSEHSNGSLNRRYHLRSL